jgi:hypothetical protein
MRFSKLGPEEFAQRVGPVSIDTASTKWRKVAMPGGSAPKGAKPPSRAAACLPLAQAVQGATGTSMRRLAVAGATKVPTNTAGSRPSFRTKLTSPGTST